MAHFTLTDTESGRFYSAERFGRGALGIAGANALPFRVWLDNWQAVIVAPKDGLFPLRLDAQQGPVAIELQLTAVKPLVLQGQDGWDRKGPEPGNASYYYSFMRLAAQGHLNIGDQRFEVEGAAWMDREWSSNALGADLVGWDWFSLQLSDGSELMYLPVAPPGTARPGRSAQARSSCPRATGSPLLATRSRSRCAATGRVHGATTGIPSPGRSRSRPAGWRSRLSPGLTTRSSI